MAAAQLYPQRMAGWKKSFNQPAKQAERVLAPGDGEAEPGGNGYQFQRACEAGDRLLAEE